MKPAVCPAAFTAATSSGVIPALNPPLVDKVLFRSISFPTNLVAVPETDLLSNRLPPGRVSNTSS